MILFSKRKRFRRLLFALAVLLLLACLLLYAMDVSVRSSTASQIISAEAAAALPPVDCILVLGCGAPNGVPGPMLTDRLAQAVTLYELGVSGRILMSGDHGQADYDEVNPMKRYAIAGGVPSEAVFMDHAGFSTYESILRAREIFLVGRLVIVTQEYHLYRALYIANALGLEAYGVPVRKSYEHQGSREFREVFARSKDVIYSLLRPAPSYLGEPIPVSGSGDLTND